MRNRPRTATTLIQVALLPLVLVACSGPGDAGAAASGVATGEVTGVPPSPAASSISTSAAPVAAIKACDLLTPAEVSAATGVDGIVTTETDAIAGQFSCAYASADGTPVAEDTIITPASPISPTTTYDAFAASAEAVTAIGDRAIWAALPGTEAGSLYSMVGDDLFTLSILTTSPDTPDQRRTVTLQLGQLAAARLK